MEVVLDNIIVVNKRWIVQQVSRDLNSRFGHPGDMAHCWGGVCVRWWGKSSRAARRMMTTKVGTRWKESEDAESRMSVPSTPSKRLTLNTTTTPTTSRVGATSSTVYSSPHYQTTRRHSLYGTEDRIVIDPGSRIWKVGFSGEGRPRDVFFGDGQDGQALWGLTRSTNQLDREEEDRMLQAKLQDRLRSVFHEYVPLNA